MAQAFDFDRPEERLTRTELTLSQIGQAWLRQRMGSRFAEALVDFLRTQTNANTQRAYSFAVLQFFGWYQKEHGRLVTPDQIRRADAAGYDEWLRTSPEGLRSWYLSQDKTRDIDLAIFDIVRGRPGVRLPDIVLGLEVTRWRYEIQRNPGLLPQRLACLTRVHTVERTPSIAQIRRGEVDVGLPPEVARRIGLDYPVPPEVFRYQVPTKTGSAAERAPTVAARLSALSSLWRFMMTAAENYGPADPLLRVNIWSELLRRAARQAPAQSRAYRAETTTTLTLFERMLGTTYRATYDEGALQMAAAQMRPKEVEAPARKRAATTYADLRDRALLLLLGHTGVRADEVRRLRRSSIRGDMLVVSGKGNKVRQVRLSPMVLQALRALVTKLQHMARHQAKYGRDQRAALMLSDDAPLIPTVSHWGANAGSSALKGIGRSGIAMMLRRRAISAGIQPGTPDFKRIHPHGIRHLFAKSAQKAGTPLPAIQAMLGHSRGGQTLQYLEEHDPEALISYAFEPPAPVEAPPAPPIPVPLPPARPAAPRPAPPPRRPEPEPEIAVRLPPLTRVVEPPRPPAPVVPERPAGLIGVGAPPELPIEQVEVLDEQEEALARLDDIYETNWGERGDRQRMGTTAVPVSAELGQLGVDADLAALLGEEEIVEAAGVGDNRLTHTYVGRSSGLVWWAGSTGKLRPDMPVMSPAQAASCNPEEQTDVCRQLGELWTVWASGEGRGPTGAAALVAWIGEALETTAQVSTEVAARGGDWVAPDAPWAEIAEEGEPRTIFREQEPDAIVAWFEGQAWQHRRYPTRGQKVIDEPIVLPDYYGDADPVAALPLDERMELLSWIAALTGQPVRDNRPVFDGASREEIGAVIRAMCGYDQARALAGEERRMLRGGEGTREDVQLAERAAERAGKEVDRLVARSGKAPGYDFTAAVADRIATRKAGTRERLADFYLKQVKAIYGAKVAADPAVKVMAACGNVPLAQEPFPQLLHVDWVARTIRDDPSFARSFAARTGTHSDCVARRMARDLWDLQKKHVAGKRQRVLTRPDELLARVEAMAAYRVPCPQALETELRQRLPAERLKAPTPVFEAWRAADRADRIATQTVARAQIEEELAAFEEDYGAAAAGDWIGTGAVLIENPARRRMHRLTPDAARLVPTPIHQLAAIVLG